MVRILLELQKTGTQIFIATHDYILLKEFELAAKEENEILYHVLYHNENDVIKHISTPDRDSLSPNAIDETYARILDDEIQKGLKGL